MSDSPFPRAALAALAAGCAASAPPPPAPLANQPAPPIAHEVAPGCFEVQRAELDAAVADWGALARSMTVTWLDGDHIPGPNKGKAWPGVAVAGIRPGALAARFGLRDGDVIFALDGREVSWFEMFATSLADPVLAAEVAEVGEGGPGAMLAGMFGRVTEGAASLSILRGGAVGVINVILEGAPLSACDVRPRLREREAEEALEERACMVRGAKAMESCYEQLAQKREAANAARAAERAAAEAATRGAIAAAGVATQAEADALIASITRIDATTFELPSTLTATQLLRVLARPHGARVVPAVSGGRTAGVKLYAVRPGSVYAALGISSGDTIDVKSEDELALALSRIADQATTTIQIVRRKAPITITYRRSAAST